MNRIINALKKQSKLIIGMFIGVILMGGISYGVNQIQSSSVSYTKSDGTTVSVKQALDDVINKSLTRIEFLEKWLLTNTGLSLEQIKNTKKLDYLADVVAVGDYVAYDAGSWTSTASKPTSQGNFGGYTSGQNKANSVGFCENTEYTTTLKGWRVLKIDTSTKTVTLVHAGIPECYTHGCGGYASTSITILNNRASEYLNSDYASSAHMLNYDEALAITGSTSATTNDLRYIGPIRYWLSSRYQESNEENLSTVDGAGGFSWACNYGYGGFWSAGIRPIVVLKSNILTTGKGIDYVGQEAWTLVKP